MSNWLNEVPVTFKYELNIQVYFMVGNQAHSGWIRSRSYTQVYNGADWEHEQPFVEQSTTYLIASAGADYTFKEYEFEHRVYTDKLEFIDKCVVIR